MISDIAYVISNIFFDGVHYYAFFLHFSSVDLNENLFCFSVHCIRTKNNVICEQLNMSIFSWFYV